MNKVYRVARNAATNTWAVAFETARVHGTGPARLTLSGIAAVVSLGVPFSRIAQAAPSASYMVAQNRETVLPPGVAGNASFSTESMIAAHRAGVLVLANYASSSGDFWRIAGAPVARSEERTVVSRQKMKRKKRSLRVAKKADVEAGAGANAAPREGKAAFHARQRITSRRDLALREAARGGDTRYNSMRGAMSTPFYHVARRPETSLLSLGDDRVADARKQVASWAGGRAPQYLSAAFTRPGRRADGVMADQATVSDVYTTDAAPAGGSDGSHALSMDGNQPLDGSAGLAPDSSGGAAAKADNDAPVYSKPWAASGNAGDVRVSMSARSIQHTGIDVAPDLPGDPVSPDAALHAGEVSAGVGPANASTLPGSFVANRDAASAGDRLVPAAHGEISQADEAAHTTVCRGEDAGPLASHEARNTASENATVRGASAADIDAAHVSQDEGDSQRVDCRPLVVENIKAGLTAGVTAGSQSNETAGPATTRTTSASADPKGSLPTRSTFSPMSNETASPTVSAPDSTTSSSTDRAAAISTSSPATAQTATPAVGDNAKQDPAQTIVSSRTKDQTATGPDAPVNDGAKVSQISFMGNNLFSAKVLQEEMQLFPTNWGSWYTKNDVYSKERLAEGLENIRQYYHDRGYLEYRAESVQTSMAPDGKGVSIAIALHEGERYTLSAVTVVGSPLALKTELDGLIRLQPGEVLSVADLQASTSAIVERLGRNGYPYATVNPLSHVDPDRHTVDMTLQVDPGRRVSVRRVEVTGNTMTRDEVVRREVRLSGQDWYDSKKLAAARDRLNRLGYFSAVDVKTVPVPDSPDQVDVDVNLVEKPGAAVNLGAGYSTSDRAMASAGITQNNVFGTGQSIGVKFSTAKPFQMLDVTQTNPYFTSGGVSRTTNVYYRANEPLYYSSDSRFRVVTQGVDLRFGIPLSDSDRLYTGVAIEHNRLDPDALTPQNYIDYANSYGRESTTVPIMVGWTRDTRDSVAQTARGYLAHAGVEYGTPVGGNQYYKADVNARYYHAFTRGVVLAMSLQGGYGDGVGNKPYPIYKNYYAGGIGSVRGYEPNSLSPRDIKTGQPIGGTKMLTGSLELKFPVPFMERNNRLNAFTFLDGGNAWGAQGASIGSNGMRFSYGTGFAWNSPVGAFKLSVGFPIVQHESDKYQRLQMQFETVF